MRLGGSITCIRGVYSKSVQVENYFDCVSPREFVALEGAQSVFDFEPRRTSRLNNDSLDKHLLKGWKRVLNPFRTCA